MSYIGNPIVSTDFPKDTFSGNGSTTAFTMSIAPASVNAVIVVVSGITQDPSTYTISGTTLTFSGAPPTGTSNISVRHLGIAGIPNVPSAGSVVTNSIADSNVTAAKIADGVITPAKLSTGYPSWDTSNNLTIGTGAASSGTVVLGVKCESINGAFATVKIGRGNFAAYGEYKWDTTNDAAVWTNNGTQIMRITSNGCLMYGTGTTQNQIGSISFSNSSDTSSYGAAFYMNTGYNGTRNAISFGYNSNGVGAIVTGTSTTSYNTSSDYRLKDNIVPMTGALSTVALLKPVTYKWKLDGSSGQGFIAHELQEVVPDAVNGIKDAVETYTDENGNEQTRIKPQGIDTSFLVATLTAAIQEQQAMIEELKTRVTALETI